VKRSRLRVVNLAWFVIMYYICFDNRKDLNGRVVGFRQSICTTDAFGLDD